MLACSCCLIKRFEYTRCCRAWQLCVTCTPSRRPLLQCPFYVLVLYAGAETKEVENSQETERVELWGQRRQGGNLQDQVHQYRDLLFQVRYQD